jgi:hypothetical protein
VALTYHVLLHGLQRAGDGRGAAVGHVSAQSFLYVAVQFLQQKREIKRTPSRVPSTEPKDEI